MKVEIKFEANLEETQDLEMVRKICQVIGANPVTVKTTDVKKSVPAQDIRTLLASKVDNHREAIRAKLTELGARNVTGLDARNYDSFYEFLKDLA